MMPIRFWIAEENCKFLKRDKRYDFPILLYELDIFPGLLTGVVKEREEFLARTAGFLRANIIARDSFRDHRCLYVEIPKNPLTTGKMLLLSKSNMQNNRLEDEDLITKYANPDIQYLIGANNLVMKAFMTFDLVFAGRAKKGYHPKLVLYDSNNEIDEIGNIASR